MIDIALLGSFSLLLAVLPQPGSGYRLLKDKAIRRFIFPSFQRGLEQDIFYNLVEGFHHGRNRQGFSQRQGKAKRGSGSPSANFSLGPGPLCSSPSAPFMVRVPLQHKHIEASPSLPLSWFCILLLDHSEQNKRYQDRCLLIAKMESQEPFSCRCQCCSHLSLQVLFPWHLFPQPESLCLHTF